MSVLEKCFEKHSFQELNTIDCPLLFKAVSFALKKYGNKRGVFFDVGCNAGSFVKVLQEFSITKEIHCFEPHPVLHRKVKELYPFVKMNPFCLSDKNEVVDFHIPMWSVGLSSLIDRPVFKNLGEQVITTLKMECRTIDSYCAEHFIPEIFFLKLDVEGAEKKVLDGALGMLQHNLIQCGIFEIGTTLTDAHTSESEIVQLLEGCGYTVDKNFDMNNWLFYL